MAPAKTYKCGTCSLVIGKSQCSVLCRSCDLWYHVQCAKISDDALKTLREFKSIVFLCENCATNPKQPSTFYDMEKRLCGEIAAINNRIELYMQRKETDLETLRKAFTDSVNELKLEISSYRNTLQSEYANCNKLIEQVDASASAKIAALEEENNLLHKRLNRADIVVNGLPSGIEDLVDVAIKLCSYFNIYISQNDINHACYMYNNRAILIKFNHVCTRDKVMKEYYKTCSLKVCDVMDSDINRRVYLNDHLSPAAGKLNSIC